MPTFGAIDYSGPDRLRRAFEGFNETNLATQVNAIGILKDRDQQAQATQVVRNFFGENIFDKPEKDILNAATKAGTELGAIGGPHAQAAAQQIHQGIELYARLKPKQDMARTPYEDWRDKRITDEQYAIAMGQGKKPEKTKLRSRFETVNGVTKKIDVYGYVDKDGKEGGIEEKYQDYTPNGSGSGELDRKQVDDVFEHDPTGEIPVKVKPTSTPQQREKARIDFENRMRGARDRSRKTVMFYGDPEKRQKVGLFLSGKEKQEFDKLSVDDYIKKYVGEQAWAEVEQERNEANRYDQYLKLLRQYTAQPAGSTKPAAPKRGSGF